MSYRPVLFPHCLPDFERAIEGMTPLAVGIYVRCLCRQWSHGFIPSDTASIAELCGATEGELASAWPSVGRHFTVDSPGRLVNKDLAVTMAAAKDRQDRQSRAGRYAVTKRWEKRRLASTEVAQNATVSGHANNPQSPSSPLYTNRIERDADIPQTSLSTQDVINDRGLQPITSPDSQDYLSYTNRINRHTNRIKTTQTTTGGANVVFSLPSHPKVTLNSLSYTNRILAVSNGLENANIGEVYCGIGEISQQTAQCEASSNDDKQLTFLPDCPSYTNRIDVQKQGDIYTPSISIDSNTKRRIESYPNSSASATAAQKQVRAESAESSQAEFDEFWKAFPAGRKKSKGLARKAFAKAIKKIGAGEIIAAAKEYAASREGNGRFVKMPSTWLNGECWSDDRKAWDMAGDIGTSQDPLGNLALRDRLKAQNREGVKCRPIL